MYQVCNDHQNRIERICLNLQCQNRALCLLCDHPHGSPFRSIMDKQSESYKKFQVIINQAIDKYFLQKKESIQQRIKHQQINLIKIYFKDLRAQLEKFLEQMQEKVLEKMNTNQQQNFMFIKKARINKNYVQVPNHIFKILSQVYEGMKMSEIFKNNDKNSSEQAYHYLGQLHKNVSSVMQSRHFRMKLKLPDLHNIVLQDKKNKPVDSLTSYSTDQVKKTYQIKMIKQSECEYDSIISDCYHTESNLFTTSYDKKLRIIDKKFQLQSQFQFNNILTKIHKIGEDVFSIGVSKEISIDSIKQQKNEWKKQNLMVLKGHNDRINDIHSLNTRIIGSSCSQGVKIWDLYKQKCQYNLKESASPTAIRFLSNLNTLIVGYNNHLIKLYSVETMKIIKKYELSGVPLMIDQGCFAENSFYVGSFKSNLSVFDTRMAKASSEYVLNKDAITTVADSIFDQNAIAVGDRGGIASIIDMRTKKVRISWVAHEAKTSLSKPRGIVKIIQDSENDWITVGCNDKLMKLWEITNLGDPK